MKEKVATFIKEIIMLFEKRLKNMGLLRAHKAIKRQIEIDKKDLSTTLEQISALDTAYSNKLNASLFSILAVQVKPVFTHWKSRINKIKSPEQQNNNNHRKAYADKKATTQAFYQLIAEINTAGNTPLIPLDTSEIKKPGKAVLAQYNADSIISEHDAQSSSKAKILSGSKSALGI